MQSTSRREKLAASLRAAGLDPYRVTADQIEMFARKTKRTSDELAELLALFCPLEYFPPTGDIAPPHATNCRLARVKELTRRLWSGLSLWNRDDDLQMPPAKTTDPKEHEPHPLAMAC